MSKIQSLFSKRGVMVGLLAGSTVLAASTFAMPGGPDGQGPTANCQRHGQMDKAQWQNKFQEKRTQRLAALKDKLQLQPGQETAWQTFANVVPVKDRASQDDRQAMRETFRNMTTPQRIDAMMARADQRRAHMAQRAEAVKQFYAQLSPEQQKVFDAESMAFRQGHRHHGHPHQQS